MLKPTSDTGVIAATMALRAATCGGCQGASQRPITPSFACRLEDRVKPVILSAFGSVPYGGCGPRLRG